MPTELDITFRNMPPSDAVRAAVEEWATRLEHLEPRMTSCHVVVDRPHKHHQKGRIFHIRLEIAVPTRVVVVDREPEHDPAHEDFGVALADAFRAARRQIQDTSQIRRGDVKLHA